MNQLPQMPPRELSATLSVWISVMSFLLYCIYYRATVSTTPVT